MLTRLWTLRVLILLAGPAAVGGAPAWAAPATVQLRVEGKGSTVYEAPVTTDGKTIQKDASGPHPCDGTNNGANPSPGPTMTSALDDGSITGGFTWAGTWFDGFKDFGIDRIGPDSNTSTEYWGYALNFKPSSVGGCQQQVTAGDEVLFGFDFFSKLHLLRLTGPAKAATGEPVTVTVTDGEDGTKIAAASVGGAMTGAEGTATLSFDSPGVRRLKAERADSLRSNVLEVCVYVPGSGGCGTPGPTPSQPDGGGAAAPPADPAPAAATETEPPSARVTSVRRNARYRRGPRLLAGAVEAPGPILQVYLRLRRVLLGGCRWYSGRREAFTRKVPCERARFFRIGDDTEWSYLLPARLPRGRYLLDVKVLDRKLNAGRTQIGFAVV